MKNRSRALHVLRAIVPYLCAFLLSLGAGCLVFHALHIAPFGKQSILALDMYWQYFPMYTMDRTDTHLANAFYSWCGGFGFNNWVQDAYYCNSIFFLLFRFVPKAKMVDTLSIIALIKIASSASSGRGSRWSTSSRSPRPSCPASISASRAASSP